MAVGSQQRVILGQNKGLVGVHIGHYQGHVGADINVIMGQGEGQYGFGQPCCVKMKVMLGSILAIIRAMLGPTSKSCWAKTKVNMASGFHHKPNIKVMSGPT